MKVGIVGNYGNENNGDEAILSGIINQLTQRLGIRLDEIVVFSNRPDLTRKQHGVKAAPLILKKRGFSVLLTVINSFSIMKSLDLLIIGGGNLLMDLYRRDAPLYSTLARLGKLAGAKVVVYGVGSGPLDTPMGKYFIKSLLKTASSISVREPQSKALLEQLDINKPIYLAEDPAFSLSPRKKREKTPNIRKIGVTCVPYFDGFYWPKGDPERNRQYIDGMAESLDRLAEAAPVRFTFYSTKFSQDVEASRQVLKAMKHQDCVDLIETQLTPDDLIQLSAEQDLIIGTRLHSLILAIVSATPVLGIAYHIKVKDMLEAYNLGSFVIPIETIHNHDASILNQFKRLESDWTNWQHIYSELSDELRTKASHGIEDLLKRAGDH